MIGLLSRMVQRFGKAELTRLLAPAILGGVLIVVIIEVAKFGGVRESLAANAEAAMIRWSLQFAHGEVDAASPSIISVSVTDSDLASTRVAQDTPLRDADIKEYANVLEKVAINKPRWIVLNWLTLAHPLTPEYLRPVTTVIDQLKLRDVVTIAVNLNATETISSEFSKAYNIVEARDCYYTVNVYCTVAPDWTWMPQQVISRFLGDASPWLVSMNLPHILPNILLPMKSTEPLTRYSFLDFRPPVIANIPEGSVVFIGNGASQDYVFRDNKEAIQRTYIADSRLDGNLMTNGIPLHEFWARMARMFESGHTVGVMPLWIEWIIAGAMVLFCVGGAFWIRDRVLWAMVGLALLFPVFEVLLVRYAQIYIPVIPVATTLVILFLSGTFLSLGFSNYSKWRLQALSEVAVSTADIKENFIHLISHNLNTPIAQLRGILDLLMADHADNRHLREAGSTLEFIRVVVRAVLNTTTMAGQELKPESIHFRSLIEKFNDSEASFFRRLNVRIDVLPDASDEEAGEIWYYRFDLDAEFTVKAIFYAMTLLVTKGGIGALTVRCAPFVAEPSQPGGLEVKISVATRGESPAAESGEFPVVALTRFLEMASQRGVLAFVSGGEAVTLRFPSLELPS